jgi:hypothetical protein
MPWYVPIVAALVGVIGGWLIRARFDDRAEKTARYLAVLRVYLELTDKEPEVRRSSYRAWALLRAGALSLDDSFFERLVQDAQLYGRPAPSDEHAIQQNGLRAILQLAALLRYDLMSDPLSMAAAKMIEKARAQGLKVSTPEGERVPDSMRPPSTTG